jgi:hypothetical protein
MRTTKNKVVNTHRAMKRLTALAGKSIKYKKITPKPMDKKVLIKFRFF